MKFLIFNAETIDRLESKVNKWLSSSEVEILDQRFNRQNGWLTLTVFYKEAE